MKKLLFLIALSVLFSQCEICHYVRYGEKSAQFEISNDTAFVNGLLGKKAHHRLEKIIHKNPHLSTLCLEDVPGSVDDEYNIKSCYLIHQKKLNTYASSQSIIASGGVDFFLAGDKRHVEEGAKLGVHSWRDGTTDGVYFPRGDSLHFLFLDFYKTIEMDSSFYWFTLRAAKADSIHWLSYDEMIRFGVIKN
ncbi:MAG: hypothetical protein ISR00_05970 [Flavobacteriales bacterium]|nr:hypothetical protein [Flavobacteriales bacterium]